MDTAAARPGLRSAAAVLWDIDGTLMTSGGVAARAFLRAVEHVTGAVPTIDGIEFGGRIDPEIATLLLATVDHDPRHVPAVLTRLNELVQADIEAMRAQTRVLPGVHALIARLLEAEVRQTVVTGNIRGVADVKLAAAGLVPPLDPEPGGYGDSGTTRVEVATASLTALFGKDWPTYAADCWIIGDTPRDLACAQALGLRCALVATGRTSIHQLSGIGADIVLSGLGDPDDVQRLWG